MYTGNISKFVGSADRQQGVVAYSAMVKVCPITGKLSNLIFRTPSGKLVIAYDQAAADQQE